MKRITVLLALVSALALSAVPAFAGWQCRMAKAADFQSPSQNTMCALEILFELGW